MTESYPALERTDVYDPNSLERSAGKILSDYDCQSILLNVNQEGFFRDYAVRESYWNMDSVRSPD